MPRSLGKIKSDKNHLTCNSSLMDKKDGVSMETLSTGPIH
jgi:hypothetical protein